MAHKSRHKSPSRLSKRQQATRHLRRVVIGIAGGIVLLFGLLTIPYPGPGWLTVIAGLAILGTEFEWAKRILHHVKDRYEWWQAWLKRQPWYIKTVFWIATLAVVIATIYLLNGYGLINDFLNLGWEWVESPLPFFR